MNHDYGVVQRRSVRRSVKGLCHVVSSAEFELIGERLLDVSTTGAMLACDAPVAIGERLVMSFRAPGPEAIWLDAEAEVARVIHGMRYGDPGYCAGLRFTYLERKARQELLVRYAGYPPPLPQRRASYRDRPEPSVRTLPSLRVRPALPRGIVSSA